MAKRRNDRAIANWPGGHVRLPQVVMQNSDFMRLTPSAVKVLMVLVSQYRGKNNGDLSATQKTMQEWGGMAPATLAKALRELQESRLIVKTRDAYIGREGPRCNLFAITWQPIDICGGKLDVADTVSPPRNWKR
jgi:hypothetical protein